MPSPSRPPAASLRESEELYQQLYALRRGKVGDHERPHKPALLLALIDLVATGHFSANAFPLDDAWHQRFQHYFEIVATSTDRPNSYLPFYHLSGDPFWSLTPSSGISSDHAPAPRSLSQARQFYQHASVAPALWRELQDPHSRHELRSAIVARYFPSNASQLIEASPPEPTGESAAEDPAPYKRSAAFRSLVSDIYDHQCVACGLRIRIDNSITYVNAAHIIPFSESRNDHPSNGLALCKNHHWAFDQRLIALDSEHRWQTSPRLDARRSVGERDLVQLKDHRILHLPKETDFRPAPDALTWRAQRLLGA